MGYSPLFRGSLTKVPGRALATSFQSGSIVNILAGQPVSVNAAGLIFATDVSDEDSVAKIVGVSNGVLPSSANGMVTNSGRVEALALAGFVLGDSVYLGKNGVLTKNRPDYGLEGFTVGDFVIFIGVVIKNEFDPSKKDLQLMIEVIGQL